MSAEPEDMPTPESVEDIKNVGLMDKYAVYKKVDRGRGDRAHEVPVEGQVFVLKPSSDLAARRALDYYAGVMFDDGYKVLAQDIWDWLERLQVEDTMSRLQTEREKRGGV